MNADQSPFERRYRGWTITRVFGNGMYRADSLGKLPRYADTLGGLKSYLAAIARGETT